MKCLKWFTSVVPALTISAVVAAEPGSQVVVVYNSRLPESKQVADYYAQVRHVPPGQVIGFDLSTALEVSRAEFRDSLQLPLARAINDRKLWHIGSEIVRADNGKPSRLRWKVTQSSIRYVVLCFGIPVRIAHDPDLQEKPDEKLRPELRRDEASVDTELAMLPLLQDNPPTLGPYRNPVFGATNAALLNPTNGVLMVTRLDGPTPEIARGIVDKALEAETNGLWGRAYFDLRGTSDPGYKTGDDWLREASEVCRRLGMETVVDTSPETFPPEFPMSQIAFYSGWYDAHASGPFTRSKVEFMPGAFAYHLHSFSAANIRSTTQNWVGPLLAKGATITMGCVYEPYLTGTPQIAIFAIRLIYDRTTFGEAAYACQPYLSWQTTFIGDPLYRPFGIPPLQLHVRLEKDKSRLVEWSYLRIADLNLAKGTPVRSVALYLEQTDQIQRSAVLNEKLADLYEQLGKPESGLETYRKALKLDPSPQQRVRLRLVIADRLLDISPTEDKDRLAQAYEDLQDLLRENPDYPNRIAIYQRMLPLARKTGRTEDAERCENLIRELTPPNTNAPASKL